MEATTFSEEITQPTINIPRAALCFARELAYPTLNVPAYMARIMALSAAAEPFMTQRVSATERAETLADFLFGQMGFRGNADHYNDPENSFLNRVLDRRLGIPISLSLIYISVAQQLQLNAYGIGLPGHFIVGLWEDGQELFLDPFNGGRRLSLADCARLARASTPLVSSFHQRWLRPIAPAEMLARMLTNLMHVYIQREDWRHAIPVMRHLQMIHPDRDAHLRDLGYLYLYNGSLREAANHLEEYLRRSPGAEDYEPVRNSLSIVAGRLAIWN